MRSQWTLVPVLAVVLAACGLLPQTAPSTRPIVPTAALPQPAPPILQSFADPQGRYTLAFPPRWTAQSHKGYGELRSPDGAVSVYTLALPGDDVSAAAGEAWRIVDPALDLQLSDATERPARGGVEAALALSYDGSPDTIMRALGQRYKGYVYLLLQRGEASAIATHQSQLSLIEGGLTISAIPTVNLAGIAPQRFDAGRLTTLHVAIAEAMTAFNAPGVSVAVVQSGQIVFSKGYGVREQGVPTPVTADTLLQVGSTGKTLTTLLLARLADQGLISWDTPVTQLIPTFTLADPAQADAITVRHLVCNCSGVPRNDDVLQFRGATLDPQALIASIATLTPTLSLGEHYQYSNQMVAVGGFAAAAAVDGSSSDLGKGYTRLMSEQLFVPLGMRRTTFDRSAVRADDNYAVPHASDRGPRQRPLPLEAEAVLESIAPAGGGLWSSANEMARYLQTLLRGGVTPEGERLVSLEGLGALWTPQVPMDASQSYGLGWRIGSYKGLRLLSHPGNTLGFTSDFALLPEAGLGVVVLSNQANSLLPRAVRERVFELAFDLPAEAGPRLVARYEAEQAQAHEEATQLARAADLAVVAPFLGVYHSPDLGLTTLSWERNALVLDIGEARSELRPAPTQADGAYVAVEAPLLGLALVLALDEAGTPTLTYQGESGAYHFQQER